MNSRIALICAPQTFGRNAGMGSVDLAGQRFFQRHFPGVETDFLLLYPHRHQHDELPYRLLEREKLSDYAAILYWGDFLHAAQYRQAVTRILVEQGRAPHREAALRQVRQGLFLVDADPILLERCLLFGGTLLFNHAGSYRDAEYLNDLRRLVQGVRRVWMREPFSALQANALRQDYRHTQQGIDCALLFPTSERTLPTGQADSDSIGVFFGRSRPSMQHLAELLDKLSRLTAKRIEWLPWGEPPFFRAHREALLAHYPSLSLSLSAVDQHNLPELLERLRDYACIVTDTYHLCVNAWTRGVPAICLVDPGGLKNGVNSGADYAWRDKRMVFYWSYDAMPFLIYTHEIGSRDMLEARAGALVEALSDGCSVRHVLQRMTEHRMAVETDLAATVTDLLEGGRFDD